MLSIEGIGGGPSLAGVAALPGGLNGLFVGLGARLDDGVEGVVGLETFITEAGLAGGPMEPPLFTVLDLRLVGEGDGGILDKVSTVLSDNDGRGLRVSRVVEFSTFSVWGLAAFSSTPFTIAASDLALGGVVLREPYSLDGEADRGEIMPLLVQPKVDLIEVLLLSPRGLRLSFLEWEVAICGRRDCFDGSS